LRGLTSSDELANLAAIGNGETVSIKVLVAEDEQNIAESLRFILERADCHVRHASDGEQALQAVRSERPDVMILDVMLPSLNGFDVLKTIRADESLQQIPVLILTAKGQLQDRKTADDLGADAFITKPFANAEIVSEVLRLGSGH